MNKLAWLVLSLAALGLLFGCNKQKPPKLDYTEKTEMYDPHGLPGEGYVGSSPTDLKYHGYDQPKEEGQEQDKDKDKEKDKDDKK